MNSWPSLKSKFTEYICEMYMVDSCFIPLGHPIFVTCSNKMGHIKKMDLAHTKSYSTLNIPGVGLILKKYVNCAIM